MKSWVGWVWFTDHPRSASVRSDGLLSRLLVKNNSAAGWRQLSTPSVLTSLQRLAGFARRWAFSNTSCVSSWFITHSVIWSISPLRLGPQWLEFRKHVGCFVLQVRVCMTSQRACRFHLLSMQYPEELQGSTSKNLFLRCAERWQYRAAHWKYNWERALGWWTIELNSVLDFVENAAQSKTWSRQTFSFYTADGSECIHTIAWHLLCSKDTIYVEDVQVLHPCLGALSLLQSSAVIAGFYSDAIMQASGLQDAPAQWWKLLPDSFACMV